MNWLMFKTDETVRFGQILSARTLRYGKFNEYIIIISHGPTCSKLEGQGYHFFTLRRIFALQMWETGFGPVPGYAVHGGRINFALTSSCTSYIVSSEYIYYV